MRYGAVGLLLPRVEPIIGQVAEPRLTGCRCAGSSPFEMRPSALYSPGVREDKTLENISAQDTRIHPGCGLRLEARIVLN